MHACLSSCPTPCIFLIKFCLLSGIVSRFIAKMWWLERKAWDLCALMLEAVLTESVQFSSVTQSCPTLCDPMDCSMPGFPSPTPSPTLSLLKLMSIESVLPSNHLTLCHPLLLLPPIPPSIRVFLNESTLRMRWPKYWSFSFSIIPSKEHPGPISFRMD